MVGAKRYKQKKKKRKKTQQGADSNAVIDQGVQCAVAGSVLSPESDTVTQATAHGWEEQQLGYTE